MSPASPRRPIASATTISRAANTSGCRTRRPCAEGPATGTRSPPLATCRPAPNGSALPPTCSFSVPPSARDRQALRDPGRGQRRPADPRCRCGTLKEEFDLLGAPFDDRGERADDALSALRASLSNAEPAYDGAYYSYGGLVVDPHAVQADVPIWIGGRTLRSLRRAAGLGDGWCPFAVTLQQAHQWLEQVELPDGFEVRLAPSEPLDPIEQPQATVDALTKLAGAGATIAAAHLVHHSLADYLEQLEALAALNSSE